MDIIKEKGTHINRHSDKILFERIGLLKFRMTGFMIGGLRRMMDDNEKILLLDPSGGPRLTSISDYHGWGATDMGEFNKKWKGMKIISFEFALKNDGILDGAILIECEYILDKVRWKKIKNPA